MAVTSTLCREETKPAGADPDTLGLARGPELIGFALSEAAAGLPQGPRPQLLGVWGRMCSLKSFLYLCIFSDYKINRYSCLRHIKESTTQKYLQIKSSSPQ